MRRKCRPDSFFMIGNDIIDLQLAARQSNWKRKDFMNKLFSRQEQCLVLESSAPNRMVWKLWSMKESAYKIHVRKTGKRRFDPRSFNCEIIDQNQGFVHIDSDCYETMTTMKKELIHTMAHAINIEHELFYGMIMNEDGVDLGDALRKSLIKDLDERFKGPVKGLQVRKNGLHIPELYVDHRKLKDLCSLSHHGRYGAYLLCLF